MTKDNDSLGDLSTDGDKRPARFDDSLSDGLTHADWSAGDLFQDGKHDVVDLTERYEITKELGKGGMATVWLATDRRLSRKVAIKILNKEQARNHIGVTRFLNEGKAAAKLNHPQIVQIHDAGLCTDGPFLVMEYVPGGSLQDKLNEGSIAANEAVGFICQLCDGLQIAHNEGIIHRDIKPANILLDRNVTPKLTDFGIARQDSIDDGLTRLGTTLGTIDYMPPEQRHDSTDVDPRSDIWSLAGTLYRMLTGEPPLALDHDLVPSEYREAVKRGLKYNRSDRFQSAAEFKLALDGNDVRRDAKIIETVVPDTDPAEALHKYIRRGEVLVRNGEHQKAIGEYSKAIELDPEDALGYFFRGFAYNELGEYQKAIDDYSRAIELDPEDGKAYGNRGQAYDNLGEHQKAIGEYSKAIELDPENAKAYYNRAMPYAHLGKHQKAIDDYSKAIELDPEFAFAYYNRAHTYEKLRLYQKAIDDYSRAIELDPEDAKAYYNRAVNYDKCYSLTNAIGDYSKAIELDPKHMRAYYNRAMSYAHLGKHQKAIDDFSKAIELGPKKPKEEQAFFNRGWSYSQRGEDQKAIDDYSKAIELDPEYAMTYYERGLVYLNTSKHQIAINDFTKAIELDPTYPKAYANRAWIYGHLGEHQKAIDDFSKAIELDPESAQEYFERGLVYDKLGERQKAVADGNKARVLGWPPTPEGWVKDYYRPRRK